MKLDSFDKEPHDINKILDLITDRIRKFTSAERILIYLFDAEEQELYSRPHEDVEAMKICLKFGQGIPGRALKNLETYNIEKTEKHPLFDAKIYAVFEEPIRSMLVVPIADNRQERLGVIQLLSSKEGAFKEDDMFFVEAMSAQAAIAIENTILFNILTSIQNREKQLAEEMRVQNMDLQKAYRQLDEKNNRIERTSKRLRFIRNVGLSFVGVIMLAVVYALWPSKEDSDGVYVVNQPKLNINKNQEQNYQTFIVEPRPVTLTQTLSGILEPAQMVNLFSPFSGQVKLVNFDIGAAVDKNQKLLELDTVKLEAEYRTAKIAEMKKRDDLISVKNWDQGPEMNEARRKLAKAKEQLNLLKDEFVQTEELYAKGVVKRQEWESAKRKIKEQEETVEIDKEGLESVRMKGDDKHVTFADYEWQNAKLTESQLKSKLERAVIYSPVPGVAIKPPNVGESKDKGGTVSKVEVGININEDAIFVSIADLARLSASGTVDEVDINKITKGQKVKVFGDAFRGTVINGEVTYVSSQAKSGGRKPVFEIKVTTEPLTDEQRDYIRLGMSATLAIDTYVNPEALMLPFRAIHVEREGRFVYKLPGEGATQPEKVWVETGPTTVDGTVEVVSGVEAGDIILLL